MIDRIVDGLQLNEYENIFLKKISSKAESVVYALQWYLHLLFR